MNSSPSVLSDTFVIMEQKSNYQNSRTAQNITCEADPEDIRIFINGILHIFIRRSELVCLQSWYINKWCCKIEIYTTSRDIMFEYNSVEKWKTILNLLNENI